MSKLNGGYVMINLNDTNNIYSRAKNAIGCGKPIMVYDDPECYYADSISLDGDDNVIIVKGGKTITITDANSVSSEGDVVNPTMETIRDLAGNPRFVEGVGTINEISGVTITYNKFSLSGTHLMLVIAGEIEDSTVISLNARLVTYDLLPTFVIDKIKALVGNRVDDKTINAFDTVGSTTQQLTAILRKTVDNEITITLGSFTATAKRIFRLQFDLLIDNE